MYRSIIMCLTALFLFTACFIGSDAESKKENESTESTAESESTSSSSSSGSIADQIKDLGKSIEEAAKTLETGEGGKAVNFRAIKKFLPEEVAGIPRENSSGETNTIMGYQVSKAEGIYRHEDRSNKGQMNIEITDAASTKMVIMGLAAWSMIDVDKEDDFGYERTMKYRGGKAYQKWDSKRKRGEFSTVVGDRFYINVKGRDIDMKDIIKVMDDMDFKALSELQPEEE